VYIYIASFKGEGLCLPLAMLSKVSKDRGMHPTTEIPRYNIIRILAG
jgi:hypothetical protein